MLVRDQGALREAERLRPRRERGHLGVGLGEQPRAFVAQMLRHAAADAQRRRTAYGGARQRMTDHEAEQRAVEQSPTGHRFPSPDEGLRQRELLAGVQAVLEQALAQRQPRYRSDLQDAWDFAHRRAVEGRSIRAQVEAERPELDADGLRKETERRTRAGQRLRAALIEVAEGAAQAEDGGTSGGGASDLLFEYLLRLAGCPGGGERGVSDLDPVEPGGEPPEDES